MGLESALQVRVVHHGEYGGKHGADECEACGAVVVEARREHDRRRHADEDAGDRVPEVELDAAAAPFRCRHRGGRRR